MTKISAAVPDEIQAQLEQLARENDRSVSAEIRRALSTHLASSHVVGSRRASRLEHSRSGRDASPGSGRAE